MLVNPINNFTPKAINCAAHQVNFGAHVCISPEEFYDKESNKNHMPDTLRKFIYNPLHFQERRTIPPLYAMKEVFGPINFAKDLDAVKMMFPNEPLFSKLTAVPNKNSREGLSGMINLLRKDPEYKNKSLFKNGDNDLGMYILKKIYLEGKTLKEINKDFEKDVSVYFKSYEIKPQDYYAYGIRYPKTDFWNSFYVNRDDYEFNRKYLARQSAKRAAKSSHGVSHQMPIIKKKREPMSFEVRKKLAEFMVNYYANMSDAEKEELKQKRLAGLENSVFHKYFGEIVTIAQNKVNLSDKMADYMEKTYGDPNYLAYMEDSKEKQSEIMKRFWKSNEMLKKDYSKAMLDTIAEFDNAYGDDGVNYDFLRLLALAKGIKVITDEGREIRNGLREEIKAQKASENSAVDEPEKAESHDKLENLVYDARKKGYKVYEYKLKDGSTITLSDDYPGMLQQKIDEEFEFFPSAYRYGLKKYLYKNMDSRHLLSVFYNLDNLKEAYKVDSNYAERNMTNPDDIEKEKDEICQRFVDEILLKPDAVNAKNSKLRTQFNKNNPLMYNAVYQVLLEMITKCEFTPQMISSLESARFNEFIEKGIEPEFAKKEADESIDGIIKQYRGNNKAFLLPEAVNAGLKLFAVSNELPEDFNIEERFNIYNKKLSGEEIKNITLKIPQYIVKYNPEDSAMSNKESKDMLSAIKMNLIKHPNLKSALSQVVLKTRMITPEMSDMRAFLLEDSDEKMLVAKTEKFLNELSVKNPDFFKLLLAADSETLERIIRPSSMELYNQLLYFRISSALDIMQRMGKKQK